MNEIYWLTRLDGLSTIFQTLMVIGIVVSVITFIWWLFAAGDNNALTIQLCRE